MAEDAGRLAAAVAGPGAGCAEVDGWVDRAAGRASVRPATAELEQDRARAVVDGARRCRPTPARSGSRRTRAVSHHEAAPVDVLARRAPEHVLAPLAVDAERGWLLLPDGGRTLRAVEGASDRPRRCGSRCWSSTPSCSGGWSRTSTSCSRPVTPDGRARAAAGDARGLAGRRRGCCCSDSRTGFAERAARRAGGRRTDVRGDSARELAAFGVPAIAAARRPARQQRLRPGAAGRPDCASSTGATRWSGSRSACCW